jgi:hypothetical protein
LQVGRNLRIGGNGQSDINTFETTIRVVGGLLAAHDLSNDADGVTAGPNSNPTQPNERNARLFLDKAEAVMQAIIDAGYAVTKFQSNIAPILFLQGV